MTDLRNQKRMASQVLGVGETSVWIDPLHAEEVAAAVTRQDIRGLVAKGFVRKLQAQGVSRGRARALALQKAKGKRKGPGSREGSSTSRARAPRKQRWMRTIRPLRQTLKILRDDEIIDTATYRTFYLRSKGGVFRSRPHLLSHLVTDGLLTEEQAKQIRARAEAERAASFGHGPKEGAAAGAAQPAKAKPPRQPKQAKPAKKAGKTKSTKEES
jgi:large subunit ribosomal protein L19e